MRAWLRPGALGKRPQRPGFTAFGGQRVIVIVTQPIARSRSPSRITNSARYVPGPRPSASTFQISSVEYLSLRSSRAERLDVRARRAHHLHHAVHFHRAFDRGHSVLYQPLMNCGKCGDAAALRSHRRDVERRLEQIPVGSLRRSIAGHGIAPVAGSICSSGAISSGHSSFSQTLICPPCDTDSPMAGKYAARISGSLLIVLSVHSAGGGGNPPSPLQPANSSSSHVAGGAGASHRRRTARTLPLLQSSGPPVVHVICLPSAPMHSPHCLNSTRSVAGLPAGVAAPTRRAVLVARLADAVAAHGAGAAGSRGRSVSCVVAEGIRSCAPALDFECEELHPSQSMDDM